MSRRRMNIDINPTMATHFPSLSTGPDFDTDVHMFSEDIHLGIMPIGARTTRRENFEVEFKGEEKDCDRAKEIIGDFGQYDKYEISEMVCDAIDNIVRYLVWGEGLSVYEIINDGEDIHVNNFTNKRLYKFFLWYLQVIPRGDWSFWKRKFTFISKKRIWKIEIPQELGGARGFKKILKKLKKYNHLGPKFYKEDLEKGFRTENFDFMEYVRSSDIYFNKVTHKWGWNRRDLSQEKSTEYYTFYKILSFQYAQAILRDHLIQEINNFFDCLEIKCKLVVIGLPEPKEILGIKNDLHEGKISFTAASDRVAI
jgi:hypothetical protein